MEEKLKELYKEPWECVENNGIRYYEPVVKRISAEYVDLIANLVADGGEMKARELIHQILDMDTNIEDADIVVEKLKDIITKRLVFNIGIQATNEKDSYFWITV